MTLSSTTNRVNYTGDGATSAYSYTFKIFSEDELLVTVTLNSTGAETTLTKTTDYTVSGVGESSGGTVTLVDASQAWLDGDGDLLATYDITIRRVVALKQNTDIRNQGSYYPEGIEDQFDKLVMADQQQQDEIDRSVKLPETITSSSFDPTLPATSTNAANKALVYNSDSDGWAVGPSTTDIANAQTNASNASASATLASQWASLTSGIVDTTDYSAKAWAIGGTGVTDTASKGAAKEWAIETASTVDGTDYSAKEYAIGTQIRGASGGGSAKDWATYTAGTVDDTERSAKYYSQQASTSATSAAASVNQVIFRDVDAYDDTDSPITLTASDLGKQLVLDTTNGAISITLPAISGLTAPAAMSFINDSGTNDVTINRAGSDTIGTGAATSTTVSTDGEGKILIPDTTTSNWAVLSCGGEAAVADGAVTKAKMDTTTTTQPTDLYNVGLAASVAANALTIALKTQDGGDPAAADPVYISFRESTATDGGYVHRSVTGALSVTVSSGSTLGSTDGDENYIYVYAIDNAGTVELAVSATQLEDEGSLVTTTAEGGAGGADSSTVIYSTTQRTNVACRLIGRVTSTQATAGTWATSPSEISVMPFRRGLPIAVAHYDAAAGYGSSAAYNPYFTNEVINTLGDYATASNSSTNGLNITFNRDCIFSATANYGYSSVTSGFAIGINGGTDPASSLANTERLAECNSHTNNLVVSCSATYFARVGDVVKIHTENTGAAAVRCHFTLKILGVL